MDLPDIKLNLAEFEVIGNAVTQKYRIKQKLIHK